jgi:SAM-dependent methyltransferase
MQTSFDSFDLCRLRDYYEEQGAAIGRAGGEINCSEPEIVNIVTQMAIEHAGDFQNVLDVGCGANLVYDQVLVNLGKRVVGMDFTWSFLKLAPRISRVALVQGDATDLPFADEAFDAVICSETVEHIPEEGFVVKELARILRPHGWLFFTVPNLWNAARILEAVKHLNPTVRLMPGHLREYSLRDVSRLFAGVFEIDKVYPVGFGWKGSRVGGRIEQLIDHGVLKRFSKSIAVAARKQEHTS